MKVWDKFATGLALLAATSTSTVHAFSTRLIPTLATQRVSPRSAFFHSGEYDHDGSHSDALAHNLRRTDPKIFLTQRAIQSFIYLLISTRDPHTVKWMEVSNKDGQTVSVNGYECSSGNERRKDVTVVSQSSFGALLRRLVRSYEDVTYCTLVVSFLSLGLFLTHTVFCAFKQDNYDCKGLENYHGTGAFNVTLYPSWDALLVDMLQRPDDVVVVSAKRRGRGHGGWSKNNPYLEDVSDMDLMLSFFVLLCKYAHKKLILFW